jgi:hypothetical protein
MGAEVEEGKDNFGFEGYGESESADVVEWEGDKEEEEWDDNDEDQ